MFWWPGVFSNLYRIIGIRYLILQLVNAKENRNGLSSRRCLKIWLMYFFPCLLRAPLIQWACVIFFLIFKFIIFFFYYFSCIMSWLLMPLEKRSPGGGSGNPCQYSCLRNPMHRGAWWTTSKGSWRVKHGWAQTLLLPFGGDGGLYSNHHIKELPGCIVDISGD